MLSLMVSDSGSTSICPATPATAVTRFALGWNRTLPPLMMSGDCDGTEGAEKVPDGLSNGTALLPNA